MSRQNKVRFLMGLPLDAHLEQNISKNHWAGFRVLQQPKFYKKNTLTQYLAYKTAVSSDIDGLLP